MGCWEVLLYMMKFLQHACAALTARAGVPLHAWPRPLAWHTALFGYYFMLDVWGLHASRCWRAVAFICSSMHQVMLRAWPRPSAWPSALFEFYFCYMCALCTLQHAGVPWLSCVHPAPFLGATLMQMHIIHCSDNSASSTWCCRHACARTFRVRSGLIFWVDGTFQFKQ